MPKDKSGYVLKSKFLSMLENNGAKIEKLKGGMQAIQLGDKSVSVNLNGAKRLPDATVHHVCGKLGASISKDTKPNKLMGAATAAIKEKVSEKAHA